MKTKYKNRFLSLILTLAMVFSLVVTPVHADANTSGGVVDSSEDDSNSGISLASEGVDEGGTGTGEMLVPDETVEIKTESGTISAESIGDLGDSIVDGVTIYLTADTDASQYTTTITASNVTIDLAGYTLDENITIASGASVTITDSSTSGTGAYTGTLTVNGTLIITGGTFNIDVSSYVDPSSYDITTNSDGTYTVTAATVTYVAQNTTTGAKNETIQEAIDAAASGETVQLLTSVTESITIASDDNITLDLAGYTVTGDGTASVITVNGSLTLADSTATTTTSDSGTVGTTDNGDGTYTTVYVATTYDGTGSGALASTYYTYTSGAVTGGMGTSNWGGGIYVASTSSLTMSGGTVTGNTLSSNNSKGAGIAVDSGSLTINGGVVAGNTISGKTSCGAGVYVTGSSFSMTGGAIANNSGVNSSSGTDSGGGLYLNNVTGATVSGGVISGNTVRGSTYAYGGAGVYVNNSTLTISGGTVSDNYITKAGAGGGIFLAGSSTLNMSEGYICNNTTVAAAQAYGGGVYLHSDGGNQFNLSGGVIAGNTAVSGGGIAAYLGDTADVVTMTGGTITENSATLSPTSGTVGYGGGICLDGTFNMTGGAVYNNTASAKGDDIATFDTDNSTITLLAASSMNAAAENSSFTNYKWYYDPDYGETTRYEVGGSSNVEATDTSFTSWGYYLKAAPSSYAKFYTRTLTLDGSISVNYYVDPNGVSDMDNYTVKFTVDDKVTTAEYVSTSYRNDLDTDNNKYYRFTVGVNAVQMATSFTAELQYNGVTVQTDTYSVRTYCTRAFENSWAEADLCAALLNYGGYAQTYVDSTVSTTDLANYNLSSLYTGWTDPLSSWDNDNVSSYTSSVSDTQPSEISGGSDGYSATLVMESETAIRIYFNLTEGTATDDVTFTVNGTTLSIQKTASGDQGDGTYDYYVALKVPASKLSTTYTITVSNGTTKGTITYSALAYVKRTLADSDSGESLVNVCKAIYYYSKAADGYKNWYTGTT